ncbi:MAG: cadherin domain-containing protein [Pseudomonadota bacterium]
MADSKKLTPTPEKTSSANNDEVAKLTSEELSIEQERAALKKAREADAPEAAGDEGADAYANLHYGDQKTDEATDFDRHSNASSKATGEANESAESQLDGRQAKAAVDKGDTQATTPADDAADANAVSNAKPAPGDSPRGIVGAENAAPESPADARSAVADVGTEDNAEPDASIAVQRAPVNEAPTRIELSSASVDENDAGAVIATLSATDPDANETAAYSIADDPSGLFEILGDELRLREGVALDHETQGVYEIEIQVEDSAGNLYTETFTIDVGDVNETPNDVSLSNASVNENEAGAVVGALSAFDPDDGDALTYTVSDDRFEVVGDELRLKEGVSFDHEETDALEITVTASDSGGLESAETFTINVANVNEAPSDVSLSNASVNENDAGAVVGTLSAFDPDDGDALTYAVSDDRFEVVGDELRLKEGVSFDHEEVDALEVTVTAIDSGGLESAETFTINVADVNEAPSDVSLSNASVNENDAGAVVGALSAFDPDEDDALTYTVSDDRFEVVGDELRLKEGVSFDHEEVDALEVTVTATDSGGLESAETFTINIADVNESPVDIALTPISESGTLSLNQNGGNDDVAVSSNVVGFPTDALTVEVAFSSSQTDVGSGVPLFSYAANTGSNNEALIWLETSSGNMTIYLAGQRVDTGVPNASLLDGEPHQVSFTWNQASNDLRVYVDGEEAYSTSINIRDLRADGTVTLGQEQDTEGGRFDTNQIFEGEIGEVRIFDHARTAEEIADNAGAPLQDPSAISGLVSNWTMDSAVGGLVADAAGDNDLVLLNGASIEEGQSYDEPTVLENEPGAVVGVLSAHDPQTGGEVANFAIADDPSGLFEISGIEVKLKEGLSVDFESQGAYEITIEATGAGGETAQQTVTINVANVDEAPENVQFDPVGGASALSLNQDGGADDYVIASDLEDFPTDALTIEVTFASSQTDVGNGVPLFSYAADNGSNNEALIWLESSSGNVQLFLAGQKINSGVPNSSLLDGEQHHVSLTWDQATNEIRFFVDGEEAFSSSINIRDLRADGTLVLGQEQDAEGGRFDANQIFEGEISEVRIFDHARTAQEIAGNAGQPLSDPETTPGLVNNWVMSASDDDEIEDLVGDDELELNGDAAIVSLDNGDVATVVENAVGAVVGSISATDPQTGAPVTQFAIADDPSGMFEIVGDQLKLKAGLSLDFETQPSHDVTLEAIGSSGESTPLTVTINVTDVDEINLIEGTNAADRLNGTNGADEIIGRGGNDRISGRGGDDIIFGDGGRDNIRGGAGDDIIDGGRGNDVIRGDAGADELRGGAGNDTLFADADDTVVEGGGGNDRVVVQGGGDFSIDMTASGVERVDGGAGNDAIDATGASARVRQYGNGGDDTLTGGDNRDTLYGGDGDDVIDGGRGRDTIRGDAGADQLRGGDGNDTLYADGDDTVVEGGAGTDRVIVQGNDDFSIDMTASSVERVDGGAGNDAIDATGATARVQQYGNGGNDTLIGGENRDTLRGGDGDDVIDGGGGNDTIRGDAGADELRGGAGNDRLFADADDTVVDGGAGNDRVTVQGDGDFSIDMTASSVERVDGGAGNDTIDATGSTARVRQYGNDGDDTLIGGENRDTQQGGAGDDIIFGGGGRDNIRGGDGADVLSGGDGRDNIRGDAGDDTIIGGADRDTLNGGDGADVFVYEMGDGADRINGGGGGWTDTIQLADGATPLGDYGIDWTIEVTEGSIISVEEDRITLSDDADGSIVLSDNTTVQFTNIEEITI